MKLDLAQLAPSLADIARNAGAEIIEIYKTCPPASHKTDGSPVTRADREAERIVLAGLAKAAPNIPVVSEENAESHHLSPPSLYFLVDPLDGTREFLKADGKGEFTVNIALIENGFPIFGVLHAPVSGDLFMGGVASGSSLNGKAIKTRAAANPVIALASISHRARETRQWLEKQGAWPCREIGSSLKFAMLAKGEGDIYPRFNPTMEWDTAAGQAVLEGAGGVMQHPDGSRFSYGKSGYRNGPFFAFGDPALAERVDLELWT